jgi:AcrR family transcriptional regulator
MSKISKGKQRVIDATMRVLKDHPIEEVTMRNIAKEAGVTTGSIYHHYANKDDLLFDVMQQSLHFSTKLYKTIQNEGFHKHGEDLLTEINIEVGKRISKVEQQKLHIQFFSDMMKRKSVIRDRYHDNYTELLDSVGNLMLKAYDLDENSNKKFMASILVAAIDGVAMQQSLGVLPSNLDDYITVFTDFFTTSLYNYLNNEK